MRRPVALTTEIALLVGGLLAMAIAVTYPLIRHMTTNLPGDLGDPVLVSWILAWDAAAFRHGAVGIFDAPSFFPYLHTLVYSEHMFGVAVFTAPLQWLSANPVLVYNIAFIGSFVQAGGGMYLLARTLTGRRDAAFLAALAYAFTPQRVAQFAHLSWLITGWLPLSLWALHRYFATGALRFLLAAAAAYVLQSLTGSYFTYFALLPLTVLAIAETWRVKPPLRRTLIHLAAAVLLCALTLAPVVSAYYQARNDHDFRRSPFEIALFSADLSDYFHAHNHVWLWRYAGSGSSEHELFPGAIVLVLAATALFGARGEATPNLRVYAAIAAATLVLSLGPQPAAWGYLAPFHGPYQWLLRSVPGLDGLRVVARSGMMVVLALSVLAAYGARYLLDRVAPRRRWLVGASLAIGVIAEGWSAPILTARFDPLGLPDDRHAYTFLQQNGPEGAVLELPMSHIGDEREMRYQYLTLEHGHRTVNGSSGYTPALTEWLYNDDRSPLADADRPDLAVEFIRTLGVRYVVFHRGAFEKPAVEAAFLHELEDDRAQVTATHAFGRTIVFALAAAAEQPLQEDRQPVPTAAIHARASHSSDRLPLLFDGDRDTRWLSADRQTGNEWIELALDAPRRIAAVRMQTAERSFGDYPRQLAIDVVEDTGTRTVFHGSVVPAFGRGLRDDLRYPWIEIPLPENRARMVRLRQLGTTDRLFWSIHELTLEERGRR